MLNVAFTVVLVCLACMPSFIWAQDSESIYEFQPETDVERTTIFNSTEFNPYYFHIGNWPRKINMGGYAQLRYETNWAETNPGQGSDVSHELRLNRARFFMEGRFLNRLHYKLALNSSDGDNLSVQQAFLKFHFNNGWRLWAGEQWFNSLREDWPDPTQTASMDNSAMDYTFGLGTSLGVMVQNNPSDKFRWWLSVNNSAVGSRSEAADAGNSDITVYGRVDYQIAGSDWSVWNDLIGGRGLPFGMMVGLYGGHMRNGSRDSSFEEDSTQIGADLNINGDGYQIVLAAIWTEFSASDISTYHTYGTYIQAAYFFRPKWQGYVRYDYVSPGNKSGDLESYRAPGIGVNYFPIKNRRWRLTAELNHLYSAINNTVVEPLPELGWVASNVRGQTNLRFQLQLGF